MRGVYLRSSLGDDAELFGHGGKVGLDEMKVSRRCSKASQDERSEGRRTHAAIGGMPNARDKKLDLLGGVDLGLGHFRGFCQGEMVGKNKS